MVKWISCWFLPGLHSCLEEFVDLKGVNFYPLTEIKHSTALRYFFSSLFFDTKLDPLIYFAQSVHQGSDYAL